MSQKSLRAPRWQLLRVSYTQGLLMKQVNIQLPSNGRVLSKEDIDTQGM
jgi:hypothetical protein